MSNILPCYQLLELNVISAQDLAAVGRSMRTYAVAWIDPDRKLSTLVDSHGGPNPAWNDKFVFRVDEDFLYDENSTITIDIYALHWFRDIHVGTAHVLAEDIAPSSQSFQKNRNYKQPSSMQFVGLQVYRPSGRPKGVLNVGVAVIDSSMRSMPLYTHNNTPAVGYHQNHDLHNQPSHQIEPELRRSKSDTSSIMNSEIMANEKRVKAKRGTSSSQITPSELSTISKKKTSSMLSGSDVNGKTPRRGKFGITKRNHQNERIATPKVSFQNECINATPKVSFQTERVNATPKRINATPKVSYDFEVKPSPMRYEAKPSPMRQFQNPIATPARAYGGARATPLHAYAVTNAAIEYGTPFRSNMGHNRRPMMTDSELGPSASEVAAAVARQPVMEEGENSTIGEWSRDERWRTDHGEMSTLPASSSKKKGGSRTHSRRRTDGDGGRNGLFSCFSVICGVECSIVCGGGDQKKSRRSQSVDNESFL